MLKNKEITKEKIDILTGWFPCQAFSIAGDRKGFSDHRGELFYSIINLVNQLEGKGHGKPRVLFLENVKNLVSHKGGQAFEIIITEIEKLGYTIKYKILNTYKYTDLPQNRERVFIVCFLNEADSEAFGSFDDIQMLEKSREELKEIMSKTLDYGITKESNPEFYYTKEKYPNYFMTEEEFKNSDRKEKINLNEDMKDLYEIYQVRRGMCVRKNQLGVCPTLIASMGTIPLIKVYDGIRRLSTKECFNLQGFRAGIDYILPIGISNVSLYKQAGNAVSVDVIELIAKKILKAFLTVDQGKDSLKENFSLKKKGRENMKELKKIGLTLDQVIQDPLLLKNRIENSSLNEVVKKSELKKIYKDIKKQSIEYYKNNLDLIGDPSSSDYVLRVMKQDELKRIFDNKALEIFELQLKKSIIGMPELTLEQKEQALQVPKEYLEQWCVQGIEAKAIGAGSYPVDILKDNWGADVKSMSCKHKKGILTNDDSGETSLAQKFKDDKASNLDTLFENKEYEKLKDKWINIVTEKNLDVLIEKKLDKIYYFVFLRGYEEYYLVGLEVNLNNLNKVVVNKVRSTTDSVYLEEYIDNEYGNTKIYKAKKRLELRLKPKKFIDSNNYLKIQIPKPLKKVNLRETNLDGYEASLASNFKNKINDIDTLYKELEILIFSRQNNFGYNDINEMNYFLRNKYEIFSFVEDKKNNKIGFLFRKKLISSYNDTKSLEKNILEQFYDLNKIQKIFQEGYVITGYFNKFMFEK